MDLLDKVELSNLDEEQNELAQLIGIDNYKKMVRSYNGTSIYIPKIESLEKSIRDEQIKKEFSGNNYKELALKYGLTETWIRNIVFEISKKIKFKQVDGQISLTDLI